MAECRIEFQIQRRRDGEDDFTEIGFGSSGTWGDVDAAEYCMTSIIQNREWDTGPGQPTPDSLG